ncbi:MAG: hypothetical protein OXF07_08140 [Rhodobacter sp.]|nr:hypothetical protein [Rhodobacter sp.]
MRTVRGDRGGELSMIERAVGGLFVPGIAIAGWLFVEIRGNRAVMTDTRVRIGIAELVRIWPRIEAVLEERPPR